MKLRLSLVLLAVVVLVGVRSLIAEDQAPSLVCPISGQPSKAEHSLDFEGGKVQFCCPNCPKGFDAAKHGAKARLQLMQTGQIKQVHCPLSHKETKAGTEVTISGVKIAFCCDNCKGAVEKMSAEEQVAKCFANADCFTPVKK